MSAKQMTPKEKARKAREERKARQAALLKERQEGGLVVENKEAEETVTGTTILQSLGVVLTGKTEEEQEEMKENAEAGWIMQQQLPIVPQRDTRNYRECALKAIKQRAICKKLLYVSPLFKGKDGKDTWGDARTFLCCNKEVCQQGHVGRPCSDRKGRLYFVDADFRDGGLFSFQRLQNQAYKNTCGHALLGYYTPMEYASLISSDDC